MTMIFKPVLPDKVSFYLYTFPLPRNGLIFTPMFLLALKGADKRWKSTFLELLFNFKFYVTFIAFLFIHLLFGGNFSLSTFKDLEIDLFLIACIA